MPDFISSDLPLARLTGPLLWDTLTRHTSDAVAVVDVDGKVLYANEPARTMYGLPAGVLGLSIHSAFSKEFQEERLSLIRRAIATGRAVVLRHVIAGNARRTVYRPIPGENNTPDHVLIICRMGNVAEQMVEHSDLVDARINDMGTLGALTPRELEVLTLIGDGLSTEQIAQKLGRSVKTIEWRRVALGNKLGAVNRVELARLALRAGLTRIPHGTHAAPVANEAK